MRPPPAAAPRRDRAAARRTDVPELQLRVRLPASIQLKGPPTYTNNESEDFLLRLVVALAREAAKRDHEATELAERMLL